MCAVGRANELAEFALQTFETKIALLFRDPFLQAEVRFDDELGHPFPPVGQSRDVTEVKQIGAPGRDMRGLHYEHARAEV
jgi:hypothetical protein